MMSSPGTAIRISVIVPSYNSGPYLREALMSALDQAPGPWEVLVQDGGSTDDTLAILRSFGEGVAWISQPDGGQSDALNKALSRATGDVIIWLNADDVLLPGSIAAATEAYVQDPSLVFAYGDFDVIDGTGALIRRYKSSPYSWPRVYSRGCYIFSGSLFMRRQALQDLGGYDATLRVCMDFDLLLRLGAARRSKHLGQAVGQFRVHGASKSSTIGLAFLREAFRVRRKYALGSPKRLLVAVWSVPVTAVLLASFRLRLSRYWPRHGRGKIL